MFITYCVYLQKRGAVIEDKYGVMLVKQSQTSTQSPQKRFQPTSVGLFSPIEKLQGGTKDIDWSRCFNTDLRSAQVLPRSESRGGGKDALMGG